MWTQVGESHRPSFRPGLEGGSSDDEASRGRGGPSLSGIEQRRSAEGQVINPPVTGTICRCLVFLSVVFPGSFSCLLVISKWKDSKAWDHLTGNWWRLLSLRCQLSGFVSSCDWRGRRRWGWKQWEWRKRKWRWGCDPASPGDCGPDHLWCPARAGGRGE